ncbi:dockerin type I repeat-containing protein, partial [Methanocalculus sp.]|uniref:dockerin type I repeat-containing protein n=1 Tax=Methanocalculus sp. TaxID=2004547 RepID=UPI00260667E6
VVDDIKSSAYSVTLSSPIDYSRTILYPEKDYFIIIDRLEGSESWIYRNVFRPASLNINPSTDRDEASVGHVNGELWFGDISYDWLSLPYNVETATGIISNDFNWQTTNPYGNDILFHLYTAPASEIIVSKRVGRVGGYNVANEVFSPNIYFRSEPMENQYRVVALLSRYIDEEEKKAEEISVTGNGNAIKVISTEYIDYTYTGKGHSTFESIATDADTVYMRMMNSSDDLSLTMIGGTFVRDESGTFLQSSEEIGYLTLQQEEMKTQINLKICSGATIALRMYGFHVNEVLKDGVSFSYWSQDENSDVLIINSAQGEHTYEIHYTEDHPTPTVTGDLNNNGEVDIGDVMMVSYMVAGLIEEDLSADFNGNGYVDVGDAAKINRFFLGLVEEL